MSESVSHGICETCRDKLMRSVPVSIPRPIETFDFPVLLVDNDVVIHGANSAAVAILGRRVAVIGNLKGGDAISCENAAGEGGCGRSPHCAGCVLRNSVAATHADGRPRQNMVSRHRLDGDTGRRDVAVRISTEKVGEMVLLMVEDLVEEAAPR